MMMLSIFGEDVNVDINEEQGLVTLTNATDDCYCTITKEQHDNLFTQLAHVATDMEGTEQLDEQQAAPMDIVGSGVDDMESM